MRQGFLGPKKAKGKGKVSSSMDRSEGRAAGTGNSKPQVSRIGRRNPLHLHR